MKETNNNRFKNILSFCIAIILSGHIFSQSINIDGNPADWPAVLNSANIPVKVFTHDAANTNADNIFTETSKDILPIAGWGWQTGIGIASIRDIENAGAALINNNLYFFGDRFGISTAGQTRTWIGVWFLLNPVAPSGTSGGSFTGTHSIGDILVLFEFAAGSVSFELQIFEWVGEGGSHGSLNFLTTTTNGAVNGVQQPVPVHPNWTYSGNANSGFYAAQSFYEGYIDVTNLTNRCFKSFLIETRSSMAETASLFDFATSLFGGNTDQDNDGFTVCNDCDDNDNTIHPGATEICNLKDDDCDGQIDEGVEPATWYIDSDNDGYGATNSIPAIACTQPLGYVAVAGDCNDNDNTIHPGAAEICNLKDDDCDGQIDEGVEPATWYIDSDNDGYGATNSIPAIACTQPLGYVAVAGDCNDNNAAVNPGATEICGNNIDDNCNGSVDEGCVTPTVSINNVSVYESEGIATLTISLSSALSQNLKVSYQTIDGTAVSKGRNKDFMSAKGSVTIPAGQLSVPVSITIYNDGISESTETFTVQISLARNVTASTIGQADGQVQISDGVAPSLTESATKATTEKRSTLEVNTLSVKSTPNPYKTNFSLVVNSSVSAVARIEFFTLNGQKVHEINKPVAGNATTIIPYNGPLRFNTIAYKVTIGKNIATGIVLKSN